MNAKEECAQIYTSTLEENPSLQEVLACLEKKLDLEGGAILDGLHRYDGKIGEYDNSVYDDVRVRAALYLKYFVSGSYHAERQEILTDFLKRCGDIQTVVDVGYGAPGLYVRDVVLNRERVKLFLLDKFESARVFSNAFLGCAYPDADIEQKFDFGVFDLDALESPGVFDVYILFDSIEHAEDPTQSMDTIVQTAPEHAQFLLSLPICSKEGVEHVHFIEWLTDDEAVDWLGKRGLEIVDQTTVGPTEADTWAEGIEFHNLIVRCKKK